MNGDTERALRAVLHEAKNQLTIGIGPLDAIHQSASDEQLRKHIALSLGAMDDLSRLVTLCQVLLRGEDPSTVIDLGVRVRAWHDAALALGLDRVESLEIEDADLNARVPLGFVDEVLTQVSDVTERALEILVRGSGEQVEFSLLGSIPERGEGWSLAAHGLRVHVHGGQLRRDDHGLRILFPRAEPEG